MSLPQLNNPDKSMVGSATDRTFASLITGDGRSAIAVIAVAGPLSSDCLEAGFQPATPSPLRTGQVRYGMWIDERSGNRSGANHDQHSVPRTEEKTGESVIVIPITEDHLEIHCHGGIAATQRILEKLSKAGATIIDRTDFDRFTTASILVSEASEVMTRCLTAPMAGIAMSQVREALQRWVDSAVTRLDAANDGSAPALVEENARQAQQMIDAAGFTTRLADRFRVVLLGYPNCGKSTLVNAIVGYDRSITTEIPGTTRDVLHAETVIDGIPIRLSDTAGVRQSNDLIEQEGIAKARNTIETADLVIRVASLDQAAPEVPVSVPILDVVNKIDLADPHQQAEVESNREKVLGVSALTGMGINKLLKRIAETLSARCPAESVLAGEEGFSSLPLVVNQRQLQCARQVAQATDRDSQRKALIKFRQG